MTISFIPYKIHEADRFILHVQVRESAIKPVICKYKGVPSIYMRRDGFTNGASYEEIIDMSVRSKPTQYDVQFSDILYNKSDFQTLRAFYALHNEGKELPGKALRSMGFFNEEGYLANGAVLFSDKYQGGKTEVVCSVFSGFGQGLAEGFEAGYGLGCQEEKEAIVRRLLKESSVTMEWIAQMTDCSIKKVRELAL